MSLNNSNLQRQTSEYTFAYSGSRAGLSKACHNFFNFSDWIPTTSILDYNGWIPDYLTWRDESLQISLQWLFKRIKRVFESSDEDSPTQ